MQPSRSQFDPFTAKDLARYWAKVQQGPGCWIWTASLASDGYGQIHMHKRPRRSHHVAWALAFGRLPEGLYIDHICRNRTCVNPAHLRAVSPKQNQENRSAISRNNASGFRGVSWYASRQKWVAAVTHDRKLHHLGYFSNREDAVRAVVSKRNELYTHNEDDRFSHERATRRTEILDKTG